MSYSDNNVYYDPYDNDSSCNFTSQPTSISEFNSYPCTSGYQRSGRAIVASGSSGTPVFLPSVDIGDLGDSPIPVASATIDTRGLRNPKIIVLFTGAIGLPATAIANVSFELSKACNNGASQRIGSSFTFTGTPIVSSFSNSAVSFQHFDCSSCPGCCTYTVSIAPRSTTVTLGPASVGGTITVFAIEGN